MKTKCIASHTLNALSDEDAKDFIRKADDILKQHPEADGIDCDNRLVK